MPTKDSAPKRFPWPFPSRESSFPEKKNPDAPSTAHEYANGDRKDKAGKNLEQQREAAGTPGAQEP